MNIALIGPSGSGKGTHASALSAQFNLLHVGTGDLFRKSLEGQTVLGRLAQKYMSQGELVPDEVVDAMMEEWVRKAPSDQGILFDGFPRTVPQARFLEELYNQIGRKLDAVIYLRVPDEEIVRRLSGRLICRKCQAPFHETLHPFQDCPSRQCRGEHLYQRPDDNPEMVRLRLRAFHRTTESLIEFYQRLGRLVILNGEGELDQVARAVFDTVRAVQRRETLFATSEELRQIRALKGDVRALDAAEAVQRGLDLVLIGGPGSGKGTQAEQLCREFELPHIATGDLFRENLKQQTPLGQLAKTYMDRGELVPNDVTESMVQERLSRPDTRRGFVLDGFPRSLPQAEALTEMMNQMRRRLAGVVYINVSDAEIVNRLSGRLICRNCQAPYHLQFKPPVRPGVCNQCGGELYQRDDDNAETVRNRLKTFHIQTGPLIDYYTKSGLLKEINGEGDVAEITERTLGTARSFCNESLDRS